MGKGERVGVSDRVAHVACRQAAYSGRTTPNGNGHRPSAKSTNRRIGRDLCARIERSPEGRFGASTWTPGGICLTRAPDGHPLSVRDWVRFEWSPGEDHAPAVGPRRAQTIVVEHRDRLARFGSESIAAALAACGRKLVVVDETEMKDDLVQDMVDVLTWFCARLYGRRAAKNRAAKALAAAQADG